MKGIKDRKPQGPMVQRGLKIFVFYKIITK